MKVIDNFLEKNEFLNIKNYLESDTFEWYYNNYVISENNLEENFQFIHFFYKNYSPTTSRANIILPIINKLKPKAIIRIKANLTTQGNRITEHGMHRDVDDIIATTAIYYINTNDGYTKFINNDKVNSVENRLVLFPSNILHTGTNCTDKKRRTVINFNFVK